MLSPWLTIIRGNITGKHVYLLLSCPPSTAPSKIVQYLKGRNSKILQEEFSQHLVKDISSGLINISLEDFEKYGISYHDLLVVS